MSVVPRRVEMSDYALVVSDSEISRYMMMAERAQAFEADLWDRAGIVAGATIADVGCGPAAVSIRMGSVVGPSGRVYGVEPDEAALVAARQLVAKAEIDNVELRHGNGSDTGLEPGSVDVAVMRHVLAHNGRIEQELVDHLSRLVRPGGSVYLVDVDGTALRLLDADPDLADLSDKYHHFHNRRGNDLRVGLRLAQLLTKAGLEVAAFEGRYSIIQAPPGIRPPAWAAREAMVAENAATAHDIERWDGAFRRTDAAEQRPTLFVPNFFAIGRRRI
jgi:ubiquinone/menaquinone biosynthesis C-methylase UbiE